MASILVPSINPSNMTLLATATPSGANTVDITNIPGSYEHLYLIWRNVFQSLTGQRYELRLNGDTGTNYRSTGVVNANGTLTLYNDTTAKNTIGPSLDSAPIGNTGTTNSLLTNSYGWMFIPNYSTSIRKYVTYSSMSDSRYPITMQGIWDNTNAITSINFARSSTQTVTGTFYLYGVK